MLESPFINEDVRAREPEPERQSEPAGERTLTIAEEEAVPEGVTASEAESFASGEEMVREYDRELQAQFEAALTGDAEEHSLESRDVDAVQWLEGSEDITSDDSFAIDEDARADDEREADEEVESGNASEMAAGDSLITSDQAGLDPDYNTDDGSGAGDVWTHSDKLRSLLERKGDPDKADRQELATALTRQISTLVLYWQSFAFLTSLSAKSNVSKTMSLYVVLFPGEGRDNTGIKDLNDKVLGYSLTNKYIRRRQKEVAGLFWRPGDVFMLAGQDYKTATILTLKASRADFAKRLAELDGKLREILLKEILPLAEKEAQGDDKRLAAIGKLKKALERDKNYKFDIAFGHSAVEPTTATNAIALVFLLVTEALKGAGLARAINKAAASSKNVRGMVRLPKPDSRALDPRGKAHDVKTYHLAASNAGDIKKRMVTLPGRDGGYDYYHIYVDTVWTTAFVKYRRWWVGHPDVIRDVRKKALEKPRLRDGNVKYSHEQQRELLELWLVVLNLLDFVKEFEHAEFRQQLVRYHDAGLKVFREVNRKPGEAIDWSTLESVLTKDVRQTERVAVLGTASEFQFYCSAADYEERIFFSMDIRDLGVALMLMYEGANEDIEHRKDAGENLMESTIKSTDPLVRRKRATYAQVVATFTKYYNQVGKSPVADLSADARRAFGADLRVGSLPPFAKAVQFMIGGDEVFVAAHPYFASFVHNIIGDLDKAQYDGAEINLRATVAFSSAGPGQPEREQKQKAHQQAMSLADAAPGTLKRLERTHRRIERLIEKLEDNPKKADQAPAFRSALAALRLTKLFARVKHQRAGLLTPTAFTTLMRHLRSADIAAAAGTGDFDLVDFNARVVDGAKLEAAAADLEQKVRTKVGPDNKHVDPQPVTKLPKWIEKLLDWLLDARDKDKSRVP